MIPTAYYPSPFRCWVFDQFLRDVDGFDVPTLNWPSWEAWYGNDTERGKRTTRKIDALGGPFVDLFERLRSPALMSAIEDLSRLDGVRLDGLEDDPELWGGGLHVMDPGGYLQVHVDYDRHLRQPTRRRAVNVICFLNAEWRQAWGGALLLCGPDGQAVHKVYPKPGRMVAFETNDRSYHGVEQVAPTCPVSRVTAAVYYLAPATAACVRTRALFIPNRGRDQVPDEVRLGVRVAP